MAGCGCQYHANKAIKGGCLRTDSFETVKYDTLPPIIIEHSAPLKVIRVLIDSLNKKDTCYTIARANTILRYASIDPINDKDSSYTLNVWIENGKLKYALTINRVNKEITKGSGLKLDNKCPKDKSWKLWVVIFCLLVALIVSLFKRY